jgi:hypothetical protein
MTSPEEIRARVARYHITLDAGQLWPDVPEPVLRTAVAELARVTTAVLAGGTTPVTLRPGIEPRALGIAAFESGLGPLLGFWSETGQLAAPRQVACVLAVHLDHSRHRADRLRHELERLLAAFVQRGIEVVLLKGAHTGYRYFPDPGTRPASDIDLLVRRADSDVAQRLLSNLGFAEGVADAPFRRHWVPPRSDGMPRSLEFAHVDDPWHVDLHVSLDRSLFAGATARFPNPDPSHCEWWHRLSQPVRVLPQPLLLAYLAFHASNHVPGVRLLSLVELVLAARRDFDRPAAWAALTEVTARTGTERHVFPALALAERLAPGTIDGAVLKRLEAATPRLVRRLVHRTTLAAARRRNLYALVVNLMWAASAREVLTHLAHLAWPRDEHGRVSVRRLLGVQLRRMARILWRLLPRWARQRLAARIG